MKISNMQMNYSFVRNKENRLLVSEMISQVNNNASCDMFVKSNAVSFGRYVEELKVKKTFNPLTASEDKLEELAAIFLDHPYFDKIVKKRYSGFFKGVTGLPSEKIESANYIMEIYFNKVKSRKNSLLERISELTSKEIAAEKNINEKKIVVKDNFLAPLEALSYGKKAILPNGILIHGDASKAVKDDFHSWLVKESSEFGCDVKSLNYNPNNPEETFSAIRNVLDGANSYNELTGAHTLLFVDGIDKLLTNITDEESLDYIDYFKTLVEDSVKYNHVTFLIKTNLDINDFDSAVIGDQRFPVKLNLIFGLTDDEKQTLEADKAAYDALDKKKDEAKKYYYIDCYDTNDLDTDWRQGTVLYD